MKAAAIKRIVLGASVAVAWCFEDETTGFTEGVLDLLSAGTEVLTPAIWPFEVANALLVAERRKRITVAQLTAFLQRIAQLPISVDPIQPGETTSPNTMPPTSNSLCAKHSRWPLDNKLRRAATRAGITLVTT